LLKDTLQKSCWRQSESLQRVMRCCTSVTRRLISEFSKREVKGSASTNVIETLTEREREVFALVAEGRSNGEIADELHMSTPTAKTHVSRILMKLNARGPCPVSCDCV